MVQQIEFREIKTNANGKRPRTQNEKNCWTILSHNIVKETDEKWSILANADS